MTIGERIKARRKQIEKSVDQIAEELGKNRATVYRYESSDIKNMPLNVLEPLARVLHTTPGYLMGWTEDPEDAGIDPNGTTCQLEGIPLGFQPLPALSTVPIVGRIACGTPILAEQNIDGEARVPSRWHASFVLVCDGNSMEPKIHDGDLVAIRKQPTVENGEIAAVRIGEEATLKRVFHHNNLLELRAENPTCPSIILVGADMETVTIEGKAVGLCRDL